MTPQQYLGLAAACVAALVGFLAAAQVSDPNLDISPVIMLILGGINVVLASASAFISSLPKMVGHVLRDRAGPAEVVKQAPPGLLVNH